MRGTGVLHIVILHDLGKGSKVILLPFPILHNTVDGLRGAGEGGLQSKQVGVLLLADECHDALFLSVAGQFYLNFSLLTCAHVDHCMYSKSL